MASDDESTSTDSGDDRVQDEVDIAASAAPEATFQDEPADLAGEDALGTSSTEAEPPNPVAMAARAYQLEMLEESLKRNIIVAMDTGSGKTQVAVLRILAELERSAKRIWFLAPTVVLVDQQLETIEMQIPAVISKRLCGADNVDTWSNQRIWDAFLENVRIVVSTPDVLLDALKHGFVSIRSLSLIVFDEAHNCKGRNGGARIMNEFYWPAKERGFEVPHILGLTASPVLGRSIRDLEILEKTLDAICRAPKRHREELISYVNVPEMSIVSYGPPESDGKPKFTHSMSRLHTALASMDITKDPTILKLRADKTARGKHELKTRLEKYDTYAQQKMRSFCHSSMAIMEQLGPWAADYYIHKVVSDFLSANFNPNGTPVDDSLDEDTHYLGNIFRAVEAPAPPNTPMEISSKMEKLIQTMDSYEGQLTGIIFAQERTTVAVMAHLLSRHPSIRGRYKVGSMVGTSQHRSKRHDFLEIGNGDTQESLRNFRNGKLNLLVATTVLEEGIDVPACNLVICFEKPKTLKSFIQRRGRARMNASKLILLLDDKSTAAATEWRQLELEMKRRYEDETRQIRLIHEIEESEHPDYPPLEVEGEDGHLARLTIEDAKAHLEHFCATLAGRKFVDSSPYYIIQAVGGEYDPLNPAVIVRATVQLPVSLPPQLRQAESLRTWKSEKNACKDAAFQAYLALYAAGLVNDHLLPLRESDIFKDIETRPGLTTVREQLDPWPVVASAWEANKPLDWRTLKFSDADGGSQAEFDLLLPVPIPQLPPLTLYWDANSAWTVSVGYPADRYGDQSNPPISQPNDMETLVALAYGHRGARYAATGKRHMIFIRSRGFQLSSESIAANWFDLSSFNSLERDHLVRDIGNDNHPYFYGTWLPSKPAAELVRKPSKKHDELPDDEMYIVLKNWPKKAGHFIRPSQIPEPVITKPYFRVIPVSEAKFDATPAIYARFGMCIPSLMHALEVYLVARELLTKRLEQLELTDLHMVATAICAPAARLPMNYERVEFLGDCILKLTATSNCLAHHPDWPEGLLSLMKDAFVSNSRLARASVDFGLDRYIITKAPTQEKWKPPYVEDHLQPPGPLVEGTRVMSTKTLADVVEALVGVSYLAGGLPKALECAALFMPNSKGQGQGQWRGIEQARRALFDAADAALALPPAMAPLERLLGYAFARKALLLEAVTHSSYRVPGAHACLERLEFFGDSLLEYLVVRRLFGAALPPRGEPLAHWQMHLLKTALVNADFLAFRVMEWAVEVPRNEVRVGDGGDDDDGGQGRGKGAGPGRDKPVVTVEKATARLPLWRFMRFSSTELALAQRATARRHAALRGRIAEAMESGGRYPWALLARLQAQKYYSDLFESLLGAVYVDSGSFEECDKVLERAGVFPYLERMLRDEVRVWHPKEELGRLAVSEKVDYEVGVNVSEEDGVQELTCRVLVGGRVVADVSGGVSREEVRTRAAEEAIEFYCIKGRWTDEED